MKEYIEEFKSMSLFKKIIIIVVTLGVVYSIGEVRLFPW